MKAREWFIDPGDGVVYQTGETRRVPAVHVREVLPDTVTITRAERDVLLRIAGAILASCHGEEPGIDMHDAHLLQDISTGRHLASTERGRDEKAD